MIQELAISFQIDTQKYFPKAQQRCRIQQTLLQESNEDLYVVNLIAEGAC